MIRAIFLICITSLLIGGCSSTDDKPDVKKVYSEETNKAFELIERGYNPSPLKKAPVTFTAPQVQKPEENAVIKKPKLEKEKVTPKVKVVELKRKESDKIIELNQNLAFYCMKHSKDPVFKNDEKKCMDHVERILKNCQQLSSNNDSKTLSCVKKRLGRKF